MTRDAAMTASDPDVSVWVAANAGSGKTYTLANRVARLLLAGADPARILCLTFTKAAAAEMQKRLFDQLGDWAMLPDAELRARIIGIGGDAHASLPRARRLFAAALEAPGGLKVLTLHAFCQILLSRFPIEADVPPAFDVLDEQSARALIAEARQHVLERAGAGDAVLASAVARLVTETSESHLAKLLDAALGNDRRKLDRLLDAEDDLRGAARRAHGLRADESTEGIAADFCAEIDRELGRLRAAQQWLESGSANDRKAAASLKLALDAHPGGFTAFAGFFLTTKNEPRVRLATDKLARQNDDLFRYLTALQARYCTAHDRWRAGRAADLAEAALTLIAAVRHHYRDAKRLRGVLDYDDLIIQSRNLLEKSSAAAWVLYKLDGGIDHVLIDEAQDTSPEQWAIVQALTAEFFAGSGREGPPRTIFAVGDEKQSIFSFQGADPAQFEINRRHFEKLALAAGHAFLNQPLTLSRRSAPEILAFVDKVFESEAARAGLTSGDAPVAHRAFRAGAKGGIEFWPALKPPKEEEIDHYRPVDAPQPSSPAVLLAAEVAGRIAGWLARGLRLPGHDAPIEPRDIMILLPRREPFGGEVIRQLKLRGIPVAGADRVRLTEQIAAMDLIALGRFALQREDDLTLAALLRAPLCGLSEEELFALAHARRGSLWQALAARRHETPAFAAAHDFLAAMLERADYAPPFEFYAHALSALGGKEMLLARLGAESADAIDEFLNLALAYEKSRTPSLEGFIAWLEQGGTEIKRDMERGRNEVRVMTVHGAKGLEADIVILPDTTSLPGGLSRNDSLLMGEDGVLFPLPKTEAPEIVRRAREAAEIELMKEHRRLLYVALTRARDRLYVCGFESKKGVRDGSWYRLAEAAAAELGIPLTRNGAQIRAFGTLDEESGGAAEAGAKPAALPAWVRARAPAEPLSPRIIRPSDIGGDGAPPALSPLGKGAARFRRGLVVHALLAHLPEIAPERRAAVATQFVRAKGYGVEDAARLVAETLAVLADPAFAAAFGPESRAEAALLADLPQLGPGARVHGRIDRLAVTADAVLILDFKTNRPPPRSEAEVPAVYRAQMALYRAGAARIFPEKRIECGLLFTDGPSLLRLSGPLLDREMADIAARQDIVRPCLDPGRARS
jgi:ATP-dependent helicase/nuclease subunit A